MLQSFDTLLGFVVLMSLVSLLITVATQMISAAFSMRGKNMANALALTFRTIDPKIADHAEALAQHIVSRPILSDSVLSFFGMKKAAEPVDAAAVAHATAEAHVATAKAEQAKAQLALEAATAGFHEAARNVETAAHALANATGDTHAHAEAVLVESIQRHRQAAENQRAARQQLNDAIGAIAVASVRIDATAPPAGPVTGHWRTWVPSGWSLPNAVRPDEVYRMLNDISRLSPAEAAQQGLSAVLPAKVDAMISALGAPGCLTTEATRKVTAVLGIADAVLGEKQKADVVATVAGVGEAFHTATAQGFDRFERWFDSAQDRAQQWFTMNMRIVTACCSVIAAGVLQLDTVEIYRFVSTNEAARAQLVRLAQPALAQGDKVLAAQSSVEDEALNDFNTKHPQIAVVSPEHKTRDAFVRAVSEKAPETQRAVLVKEFTEQLDRIADKRLKSGANEFKDVVAKLESAGFPLVPPQWPRWTDWHKHIVGMLFTGALLSLGAPFWFNALKRLSSLRPLLAQAVDEQPRQTPDPARRA